MKYLPDPNRCDKCIHMKDNCSALAFSEMDEAYVFGGSVLVKCSSYVEVEIKENPPETFVINGILYKRVRKNDV